MRTLIRLAVLLVVSGALSACATSTEETWIHPDTGSVPPRTAPQGG